MAYQNDIIKNIGDSVKQEAGLHEIKIQDKIYTIELLDAGEAFLIACELFQLLVPAFASYLDSSGRQELVLPEEDDMFTQMSMLFVRQMDKMNVAAIYKDLVKNVYCQGVKIDVGREFRGNLGGLLLLLEFILKENCGDFISTWLKAKGLEIRSLLSQGPKEETSN